MVKIEETQTCFQALFAWQKLERRKRELVLQAMVDVADAVGRLRDETRGRGFHALASEYQASLDAFESAAALLAYSNDTETTPE